MDVSRSINMPEAMVRSVENITRIKNCTANTIIKLAIARFLFDQTIKAPEVCKNDVDKNSRSIDNEFCDTIPLERIVAVQYTLDDGRIIHIIREKKLQ